MPVCPIPPLRRIDLYDASHPAVHVDYVALSLWATGLLGFVLGLLVGVTLVLVLADRNE